jgi:orotidine-5'-phosphate decarboxylase
MGTGLNHLILALDVERVEEGRDLLSALRGELKYVKIGHQLYARGGIPFLKEIMAMDYAVFLDIKVHDIPNTVFMAVDALASEGLWALTLHCGGGRKMLEEARRAKEKAGSGTNLLGVTVLTSFDDASWEEVAPGAPWPWPWRNGLPSAGRRVWTASSVPPWTFPWSPPRGRACSPWCPASARRP